MGTVLVCHAEHLNIFRQLGTDPLNENIIGLLPRTVLRPQMKVPLKHVRIGHRATVRAAPLIFAPGKLGAIERKVTSQMQGLIATNGLKRVQDGALAHIQLFQTLRHAKLHLVDDGCLLTITDHAFALLIQCERVGQAQSVRACTSSFG